MGKYFKHFEKMISVIVDIMLGLLVLLVLVVMAEAIYKIVVHVIPLHEVSDLSLLIEEIATLFILLDVIALRKRRSPYSGALLDFDQYHSNFKRAAFGTRKRVRNALFGLSDLGLDHCAAGVGKTQSLS
jgi:hypothetical protein